MAVLAALSYYDIKKRIIPNRCIVTGICIWIAAVIFSDPGFNDIGNNMIWMLKRTCSGAMLSVLILLVSLTAKKLLHKNTLGMGDIKLIFTVTLYSGLIKSMYSLFTALFISLVFIFVSDPGKRAANDHGEIPLGPFISGSAIVFMI